MDLIAHRIRGRRRFRLLSPQTATTGATHANHQTLAATPEKPETRVLLLDTVISMSASPHSVALASERASCIVVATSSAMRTPPI
jgi:hypothetical protein